MHPQKMKSMQTKGKNKKTEKLAKFLARSTNRTSRPDLSNLRKPIDTSVSDLYQVSGLLEDGTDEVKSILSYECNIIYECRTCHSLFRSIVNLVSHKREYCREKFDITLHRSVLHNYNGLSARELLIHMYKTEQTSNNDVKNDRILRSQVPKEPNKKDLSTIIDRLNKRQESMEKQLDNENAISNTSNDRHIYLEAIDTNCSAVYQTIKSSDAVVDDMDLMKEQITELHNMTNQSTLALEDQMSENQVEKSDSPIQADMSDEENESLIYRLNNFKPINNLCCSKCNAKFSTKKTLTVHVKKLHTPQRICYPCPCCTNIFANTWSVYRHLYKVHKKSNEQVRKLRPQIQEEAFHRKTTAMKGIENVRAIKVSALGNVMKNSDKTQEPISHTESNTKLCGRRGRKSNRKASLPTYLQYCQTPIAACDETTIRIKQCNKLSTSASDIPGETEDVNLVTNTTIKPSHDKNTNSKHTSSSSEICQSSILVQDVSCTSLSKEDWDMLGNENNYLSKCSSMDNNNDPDIITSPVAQNDNSKSMSLGENRDNSMSDKNLKLPDTVCTDTNEISSATSKMTNKKRKASQHDEKQLTDSKEKDMIEVENDDSKLQSSCSIPNEENQTSLMESKIATIANFRKLRCLLCKRKFTSVPNLRRHMATHIGWNRYRCKLCDFKCFVKCDCVAHCNKMHNMQNDRAAIAEMVLVISQNEYACNEDIIMDVTNPKEKSDNPDITDVTTSSCQPETRVENSDGSSDSDTHDTLQSSQATSMSEQVVESHGNTECQNVDAGDSEKTARVQDLPECVMNCGSGKLDDDPELKRMVMEVIFGSTHISASGQDSDKPALETSDGSTGRINADDNVNSATSVDESKEPTCPILDNVKHQRPMRNRIRPLNEDFIYDLKEIVYRKESAFISNSETLHVRKKAKLYN